MAESGVAEDIFCSGDFNIPTWPTIQSQLFFFSFFSFRICKLRFTLDSKKKKKGTVYSALQENILKCFDWTIKITFSKFCVGNYNLYTFFIFII